MKAMIFNGALERRPHSTAGRLCEHITNKLSAMGVESVVGPSFLMSRGR